jgi:hypothetical protein
MGLFDWGRKRETAGGAAADPVMPGRSDAATGSADEQAIARYRYMLRTAPPEAIEQAHAEAFAQLTPEQRRAVLEHVSAELPPAERDALAREGATAGSLARAATRAEIRRPGTMERTFGGLGAGGGPGFGSLMAGTMLSTMAGMVLGSAIAHHFFQHDTAGDASAAGAGDAASADAADATYAADETGDFGGDLGGGDFGGFDV